MTTKKRVTVTCDLCAKRVHTNTIAEAEAYCDCPNPFCACGSKSNGCDHDLVPQRSVTGRQHDGQEVTVDQLVCTKCGYEEWD